MADEKDETTDATEETAAETPTEPTAAADEPDDPAAEPAAASSGMRRSVAVPVWALGVLALLVIGLVGFGIGRWTAPDDDDNEVSIAPQGQVDDGDDGVDAPDLPDDFPTEADRVILGVQVDDSTDPDGAELVEVLAIGPAGEAGLEIGDVVTAVDGEDVATAQELADAVASHESGDEVTITYERDGESDEVDVTLKSFSEIEPPGRQGGETDSSADAA